MIKYQITCSLLRIRVEPTTKSKCVGFYEFGEFINTGGKPFKGEDGNLWIRYFAAKTGIPRYVCFQYKFEKYLTQISCQNNLGITQNEINNNTIIENSVQENNSRKEKEIEENNKVINFRDIPNQIIFKKIEDIKINIPSFCIENDNEIKFDGNSISLFQNQSIEIPEFFKSQESYQFDFFRNPFLYEENNSLTLNSQEYKKIYLLPQDKNSLNLKVKRENSSKIMFINYQIKARPIHDKFSFDNMMKRVKSLSIDIIIDILNIKINEIIKLKEIEQIVFLKIELDTKNPTKKYYLDLLHRSFSQIIGSNSNKKYKNKDGHNKEIIEKIAKIYEKGNYQKGIKELVDFLNMKYIDFWNGLKLYMNQGDKNIISVNEKKDNNIFLTSLIEEFIPKVDEFLNKKKESENYKAKFKELLGDIPLKINNMKGEIKKKYD